MSGPKVEWENLPPRRALLERIDRMDISADAKAATAKLIDLTVEVGGRLIAIGKAVLSFVFDLAKRFPHLTFGVLIALVVSYLIAAVPLIGSALSALLTPLLVAFGLTLGAVEDVLTGALRNDVAAFGRDVEAETSVG